MSPLGGSKDCLLQWLLLTLTTPMLFMRSTPVNVAIQYAGLSHSRESQKGIAFVFVMESSEFAGINMELSSKLTEAVKGRLLRKLAAEEGW